MPNDKGHEDQGDAEDSLNFFKQIPELISILLYIVCSYYFSTLVRLSFDDIRRGRSDTSVPDVTTQMYVGIRIENITIDYSLFLPRIE